MRQSIFNTHVPLANDQVFLMNTFNDAQLVASSDVFAVLNRLAGSSESETSREAAHDDVEPSPDFSEAELAVLRELREHGFVVDTREAERAALDRFFVEHRNHSDELHLTVLTTLQCNFACDYCLQGRAVSTPLRQPDSAFTVAPQAGDERGRAIVTDGL